MAVFVAGLVGMIAFYILILVVGLVAGRKKNSNINSVEHAILADRNFGYVVGSLTLIGIKPTYVLTKNFNLTQVFIDLLIYLFVWLFIYLSVYLFVCFIFIHSFIYSFIYLFIYLFS